MKKEKIEKTNAVRALEKLKINHELLTYEVDEEDLSAIHLAQVTGQSPERIFKTLVLEGNKTGYFVCVISGDATVNLKKAAAISGNKKCDLIPMKELLPLTGYIRGGCSPIGMKKQFPTFIDETVKNHETVCISAGKRGLQLVITPADLLKVTQATIADLT